MTPQEMWRELGQAFLAAEGQPPAEPQTYPDQLRQQALALQKQAFDLFREADQDEHEAGLVGATNAATLDELAAAEEADRVAGLVRPLIAAEREAEDRSRAAAEHARITREAEAVVRGKGTPEEQTQALIAMRTAAEVAVREQSASEGAQAARQAAENAAGKAREELAETQARTGRAMAAEENPGRAPVSMWTGLLSPAMTLYALGGKLTDVEAAFVSLAAENLAHLSGAERYIGADAVRKAQEEAAAHPGLVKGADGWAVVPPGSRRVPGGTLPGTQAVPDPARGGPVLALNQGNQARGDDTVFRHPLRRPAQ